MGAFFLYKRNSDIDLKAVKEIFKGKGFKKPNIFELGSYTLLLYKKILINEENYLEENNNAIYAVGTIVYKGRNYKDSLKTILKDFIDDKFNPDKLIGSFCIFIKINDDIKFFIDRAGIQNVYFNNNKTVTSSSFLAVAFSEINKLNINKNAVTEILLTGNLIGPDTIFKEVNRIEVNEDFNFPFLKYIILHRKEPEISCKTYLDCLDFQIKTLDRYFLSLKKLAERCGTVIGLTGGFDSRLLMALTEKHFNKILYFSHWRKKKNKELEIAEELAKTVNKEVNIFKIKHPLDMAEEEALNCLKEAFLFYDGHIRAQAYWHEEYNTKYYEEKVFSEYKLGLHGIGGEQYRNCERMVKPYYNFGNWLRYDIVYRYSGKIFKNKKSENKFLKYIEKKIRNKLIFYDNQVNLLTYKRYFNEIYNLSNRGLRTNIENQVVFFVSPFTEYSISHNAYKTTPFLGPSLQFEADMIKKINPELAKIPSNYGFSFYEGEPLRLKLLAYAKDLTPKRLFFKIYNKYYGNVNDNFYYLYSSRFNFMNHFNELLRKFSFDIDIEKLKKMKFVAPLLISFCFFIEQFKEKLYIE